MISSVIFLPNLAKIFLLGNSIVRRMIAWFYDRMFVKPKPQPLLYPLVVVFATISFYVSLIFHRF